MQDALLDRILPSRVLLRIEVLVDGRIGFFYLCAGSTLEVHVQVLGQVPAQLEVAVPEELFVELQRQVGVLGVLKVALLQFKIVAAQFRVEGDGLRQVVEAEGLGEVKPLGLALHLSERFPGLIDGRVAVGQSATPLVVILIDGGLARGVVMAVAVGQREVCRVVGHGVPLGLDTHPHVGEREVARQPLGHGYRLHGVALVTAHHVKGFVEFHVRIEGVVLRPYLVVADGIVEGDGDLRLVGEELSQFQIGHHRVGLLRLVRTLQRTFLQAAEAVGHVASREGQATEVGELDVERARGSPSALVVIFLQAQFVDPHLARLLRTGQVSHADDHRLDLAETGITHNTDLVVGLVVVIR